MAKKKRGFLIPRILGLITIVIGLLLYPFDRMTPFDMNVAFEKLVAMPLQPIRASGSSSISFTIPNTSQWKHIRKIWDAPRYVLAIDSGPADHRNDYLVDFREAGIKVELFKDGQLILLEWSSTPYGHSSEGNCCHKFIANPGEELTLFVTAEKDPAHKVGKELFVIADWGWFETKDRIVGAMISDDIVPFCRWTIGFGCLLLLISIALCIFNKKRDSRYSQ
jgi:hypothetical protein